MSETRIDLEAEQLLREVSDGLTTPARGECVICFVHRMLDEFGCDTTLRFAARYRDVLAPRATGLERRLGQVGGYCDCEIFLNGLRLHPRFWTEEREVEREGYVELIESEPPEQLPPCAGVRRGSTQQCENWLRPGRGGWWG